ncbi:unnamed protein product [Peronospora farinosa]|uniref:Polycystin cation channel PKD1/PKD2 domain-containing protein n=1 Tax=Peronospora farinosa TaxID=134698 RepID=A0AAV0TMN3_9STRA|nr:unnamed protein product [Peronospora farinosa]
MTKTIIEPLSILRVVLHVATALLLSLRSSQLDSALHPFQRAIANNWVRLLFYVDASKTIGKDEEIVTLPHFLLEAEEEIAANVDDQFFSGGFAARTSALPVGALFTIEETRQHLHGAVLNYFRLADVALDSYLVYCNESSENLLLIPPPMLTVRADIRDETLDQVYNITNASASEQWPAPLRMGTNSARHQETRAFFDALDAMELKVVVGMKRKEKKVTKDAGVDKLYEWTVVMRYDLLNQGHLEVTLNYNLVQVPLLEGKRRKEGEKDMPPVLLDTSVTLNWVTLVVIGLYQAVECSVKWTAVKAEVAKHSESSRHFCRNPITLALSKGAKDFWFWFVLAVNFATAVCFLATWRHAYQLSLRDTLCFTFACCCALQWSSFVRYLQVNTRFQTLGLTLRRGLPRVMQFLIGVLPIFIGFVLFGTVMFGAKVPRFQSASVTATTLFSVANGDEVHDTFIDVAYTPWIGQIYVYSYMILFSYVVLMVCIGIIEDAFFSAVFAKDSEGRHMSGPKRTPLEAHKYT